MGWFSRDHTARALCDYERQFLAALVDLLEGISAPQIDENETALTADGSTRLIVLIPHRALGGISIVVWLDAAVAEVTWAQVAGLVCCHDSLDLGIGVGRFRFKSIRSRVLDFSRVLECIRLQITGPVTMRCFGNEGASILVHDEKWNLCEVGRIGPGAERDVVAPGAPLREVIVRLTDSESPPVAAPSGVDAWFDSGLVR